jgi:DNA-binding NarL/FixJ family response regulator
VPGKVVLLEFSNRMIEDHGVSLINFAERTIRFVFEVAKHPVIVCMGDSIAAQTVVHWLKLGVFTYLERNAGLDRVQQIFAEAGCRSTGIARSFVRYESLLNRWNSISDREANVLEFLLEGIPNKTIANRLGVSQRTIETRRHNLYEKLESRSVAEVVRIIYELGGLERTFRRQHEPATVGPRPHFHLSRALPPLNAVTYDIAIRD